MAELPQFNTSASFINSLPKNFNQQGQQAVLNSAANLNQGSSGMRVSNAAPTSAWGGAGTQLSVAGQTGYQQPSQNLPQVAISGPPPAPGSQGPMVKEWQQVQAQVPDHPPFTNSDGSDTEFGKLAKMDRNPSQESDYQRMLFEWRINNPQPAPIQVPPPVAPPPAMPPQTQVMARPVGSTAALPSIGDTGSVGQKAFGATTMAGAAGKDLQSIKGLPLDLGFKGEGIAPRLPTGQIGSSESKADFGPTGKEAIIALLGAGGLAALPFITGGGLTTLLTGGGLGSRMPQVQNLIRNLSSKGQNVASKIEAFLPEEEAAIPRLSQVAQNVGSTLTSPVGQVGSSTVAQAINPPEAKASLDISKAGTSGSIYNPKLTDAGIEKEVVTDPTKKYGAISTVLPQEQHGQVLQMYNTGQISKEQAVQAIASPEAKQSIGKMINTAVKAGDFGAAKRLADLAPAIDEQLAIIDRIGRAVLATAGGFGTPNAPGVTEARMPMVQMGVGQALTTPQPDFSRAPMSAQSATLAPYLRPRFDEVQQNKPPLYPYMNGR